MYEAEKGRIKIPFANRFPGGTPFSSVQHFMISFQPSLSEFLAHRFAYVHHNHLQKDSKGRSLILLRCATCGYHFSPCCLSASGF